MDFDLPEWNSLAQIEWAGQPLLLFEKNNEVLMLLAEKRQDKTIGFACSACKPFIVKGDSANLDLVHFSTEVTLIKKINASNPESFLLAFTKPTYVQFSKNAILQTADLHSKQLNELNYEVKNLSNVTIAETDKENNPLLGDPSLLFSFLSMLRSAAKPQALQSVVGLNLSGEKVTCQIPSVSLGLTVGATRKQRLHVLHLLIEEVLQQNVTVVIFDNDNSFAGLSRARDEKTGGADVNDFKRFSLPGLAAGFPFHELAPGKNAFVPLSTFSASTLLTPFGLNDSEVGKYIENNLAEVNVPANVNADVNNSSGLNQFTALRVNRTLKVMSKCFQGIFSNGGNVQVSNSFGKVLHINLSQCTDEAKVFFSLGLFKQLEKAESPVFLVFEEDADKIKPLLEAAVNQFLGSNVSILCHAEHENDVPFVKNSDFFVEVLENDVVITQAGKPPQRVKLRPTYSACSEN
ncbi:MAG: hypothetical protein V1644_01390 [Candidatus Micrarchaeota archaeon]